MFEQLERPAMPDSSGEARPYKFRQSQPFDVCCIAHGLDMQQSFALLLYF
jgi:hypothetical protein